MCLIPTVKIKDYLNELFRKDKNKKSRPDKLFSLSVTDIQNIWDIQHGLDIWTGTPLYIDSFSLDRIYNNKPHIFGNIMIVHAHHNNFRGRYSWQRYYDLNISNYKNARTKEEVTSIIERIEKGK